MNQPPVTAADIQKAIRNIPDFPQPGIQFKDITPVLGDARLLAGAIDLLVGPMPRARLTRWWALTRVVSSLPPQPPCV